MMLTRMVENRGLSIILLIVLGLSAYAFVFWAPFMAIDDSISIIYNEDIKDFSRFGRVLTSSFFGDKHYYRPLVPLSFMLDYHLFGLNPAIFHLTNVLLHVLTAIVLFFLMGQIWGDRSGAFFTALLFVIHPVHSEAVSYVAGRSNILSALFVLLAFLFFILSWNKKGRMGWYAFSLASFFSALLAKESAVILPILLIAYLLIIERALSSRSWVMLSSVIPYFVLIGVYVLIRHYLGIMEIHFGRAADNVFLEFTTFLNGCLTYLRLFLFPVDLYFDRAKAVYTDYTQLPVILTWLTYAMITVLLVRYRRYASKYVYFFIAWFGIFLFPVSQLITSIGMQEGRIALSEHFLYGASAGIIVLMVMVARKAGAWMMKNQLCSPVVWRFFMFGIMLFLTLVTLQQNLYVKSPIAVLKRSYAYDPQNVRVLYGLGHELALKRRFQEASIYFRKAMAIDPNRTTSTVLAHVAIANALAEEGKLLQAIAELESIREGGELKIMVRNNLRSFYRAAIYQLKKNLQENPNDTERHLLLGRFLQKTGNASESMKHYHQAMALNPDDQRPRIYVRELEDGQSGTEATKSLLSERK